METRQCTECGRETAGPLKHYVTEQFEWRSVCEDCLQKVTDRKYGAIESKRGKLQPISKNGQRMNGYLQKSLRISSFMLVIFLIIFIIQRLT